MTGETGTIAGCPMIGLLAVRNQLITKTELENGLRVIADTEAPEEALIHYFLSNELISAQNVQRLSRAAKAVEIRKKEFKFGAIAVRKGYINQSLLDLALEEQEMDIKGGRKPRLIGDMLVESGLMTQGQRDGILKLQKRVRPKGEEAPAAPAADAAAPEAAPAQETPAAEAVPTGPHLSCHILNGGLHLQVDGDRMSAYITKTEQFDPDTPVSRIKEALYEHGIISGIMADEMIEGFVRSSGYRQKGFRVARGIQPIHGRDAKIEYFFNIDYLKAGGMDDDGNIDFRQRGHVPHVEPGTLLAEKTPMIPFRQGKNIYGEVVETSVGQDVHLRFGKGAQLSEDGLKVLAGVKGFPKFSLSGVIFVHQTYTAAGDVDYETGHIEYPGNVRVIGNIKAGFRVEGADVEAKSLDGGIVNADGDLFIKSGIVDGTIHAKGNVFARFIRNSTIICMGSVVATREVVDSQITCSGTCSVEHGKIISSTVAAKMGIEARNVGTEMAVPCSLQVGLDVYARTELTRIREERLEAERVVKELEQQEVRLQNETETVQEKINRLAHVQDRSQLTLQDLRQLRNKQEVQAGSTTDMTALNDKIQEFESRAAQAEQGLEVLFDQSDRLEQELDDLIRDKANLENRMEDFKREKNNLSRWSKKHPGKAVVKVAGAIQPGTQVKGCHSLFSVEEMMRFVRINEVADDGDVPGQYQMKVTRY